MSERPCSPPDLQETPPRLCRRQEAPAVLRSAVASLQSSRRVPCVRLHILSPLHTSLGPNLPTYKRTQSPGPQPVPVASPTPLLPQRAHLRVRPHPQGQGSGPPRTSLGTKGSWAYSARLTCCTVQGAFQAVCAGASAPAWDQQGWCQPAKPSQSLQSASAAPGGCQLPCPGYSVGPSTAAGLSLPPLHPHPAQGGAPGTNQREAAGEGRGRGGL